MTLQATELVSRRGMIAHGAAATILASAASAAPRDRQTDARTTPAGRRGRPVQIGLQLYSVRKDCEADLDKTVAAVAKMGYKGVEFAGYYGRTAKQMKKLLDDNGLVCCGTHTGIDTLLGDKLAETIEYNKTIGNKYLVVPGLPEQYRASAQAWRDTAKLFNELSEKVRPHDMYVGYHNHSVEFQPLDGELPWEIFCSNTNERVIMQLDTGNALHGGADPLPFLYRYPGKAITVHLKEFSAKNNKALVGEGDINWRAFFALCRAVGGTQWYIVEQESYAYAPLECVDRCLKNLQKMRLI